MWSSAFDPLSLPAGPGGALAPRSTPPQLGGRPGDASHAGTPLSDTTTTSSSSPGLLIPGIGPLHQQTGGGISGSAANMLECCPSDLSQGWGSTGSGTSVSGQTTPSMSSFLQSVDQVSRGSAFVLSNPPLAALHNMTEMKMPPASSGLSSSTPGAVYTSMSQAALKQMALNAAGTPHGIQDILSRSHSALAAHYGQLTAGLPRLNLSQAGGGVGGVYLGSSPAAAAAAASRFPKPLAELPGRSPIYWPGVLQNPANWRPQGEYGEYAGI